MGVGPHLAFETASLKFLCFLHRMQLKSAQTWSNWWHITHGKHPAPQHCTCRFISLWILEPTLRHAHCKVNHTKGERRDNSWTRVRTVGGFGNLRFAPCARGRCSVSDADMKLHNLHSTVRFSSCGVPACSVRYSVLADCCHRCLARFCSEFLTYRWHPWAELSSSCCCDAFSTCSRSFCPL